MSPVSPWWKFPMCDFAIERRGSWTTVVGSDAEPQGAEAHPPPDTDAEFVIELAAVADTSTTTVIAGYAEPDASTSLRVQLTAWPVTEQAHHKLSDRELQTLVMIASGKRLSDIAEELMLSPKTVSVYRARVLEKLGLTNNSELTVYAIRNGLVAS